MDYPVTREWTRTMEDGTEATAFVYMVQHTADDAPHVPHEGRYTTYTATPEGPGRYFRATHKGAMRDVEWFTREMDAREGWARTK